MAHAMGQLIADYYVQFMSKADKRIGHYPLMGSPLPTLAICCLYLVVVKRLGPQLMANRKPFGLKPLLVAYNFAMVALSAYLFLMFGVYGWFGKYDIRCQPVDYSDSEGALQMVRLAWIFYFSKIIELVDTLFFVLRKKDGQITALHVIHHFTMPFNVWLTIKFAPGGHSSLVPFINSFVHVVMYTYYGLAAIGPQLRPYLWWKKYITSIQLVQFVVLFAHSFQLVFRDCDYPRIFMGYIGVYAILFLFMFSSFYQKAYSKRKEGSVAPKDHPQPVPASEKPAPDFLDKTNQIVFRTMARVLLYVEKVKGL